MIDDHEIGERANLARLRVDIDVQIARRTHAFFRSREQGVGNRLEQDFAFDPALPLQVIQHCYKLGVHKNIQPAQTKKSGTPAPTPTPILRGLGAELNFAQRLRQVGIVFCSGGL